MYNKGYAAMLSMVQADIDYQNLRTIKEACAPGKHWDQSAIIIFLFHFMDS